MASRDALPLDPVPEDIDALWLAALDHAGYSRGDVELMLFDGDPTAREPQWGMHLGPSDTTHDLERVFTDAQREAVDELNPYKHRVMVWIGDPRLPPKVTQALMRHELRHAQQFSANEIVYRIGIMTVVSLGRAYAGKGKGAVSIRRFAPHEADANAAASQLVRPAGDAATAARDGSFRPLVTSTDALRPLDELGRRAIAFAALHPDAFATEAQARGASERLLLEELDPSGPSLFQQLRDDEELTAQRAAIAAAIPTADAIAAAGEEPARAWAPLRERVGAALQRAGMLVGLG
jgi:hypothetical protein